MASPEVIYIQSDNVIEVSAVINVATGAYINDATVTLTLIDAASGDEIDGQPWPLALGYIAASNGNYRGTISDEIEISSNQTLKAQVTIDGGPGLKRYWERTCVARVGD